MEPLRHHRYKKLQKPSLGTIFTWSTLVFKKKYCWQHCDSLLFLKLDDFFFCRFSINLLIPTSQTIETNADPLEIRLCNWTKLVINVYSSELGDIFQFIFSDISTNFCLFDVWFQKWVEGQYRVVPFAMKILRKWLFSYFFVSRWFGEFLFFLVNQTSPDHC